MARKRIANMVDRRSFGLRGAVAALLVALVAGCGGSSKAVYPTEKEVPAQQPTYTDAAPRSSVLDSNGLLGGMFGGGKSGSDSSKPQGVAVNQYLWYATLDTIHFMPLQSEDPFGGVIITDWYQPNPAANERFKLSVFITDRNLRADALRVNVFRQTRADASSPWVDSTPDPRTGTGMENAILTRANQLRVSSGNATAQN